MFGTLINSEESKMLRAAYRGSYVMNKSRVAVQRVFGCKFSSEAVGEGAQPEATADANSVNQDKVTISKLEEEVKSLKEKVLRCYAEEDNVRRIAKRDVENARAYANASFAKALLEIADDLDLALAAIPPERRENDSDKHFAGLVQGIIMTDKNLLKIFEKFGIQRFGAVGDKFDPTFHNALFNYEDKSKESGSIGQVLKTGYKLHDRVIRAADVGTVA